MDYRNLQIPSQVINKLGIPQIVNIIDQLPVNPKYTWAQLAGTREVAALTTLACHHDAYPKKWLTGKTALQHAVEIAQDHIKLKMNEPTGDAGFPYHFMIYDGTPYQTNHILDRVYGVGSNNAYTVHVMVAGEYAHSDVLTDADRNALYGVLLALKQPEVLPAYQEIKAHKEFAGNLTECPGYDIQRVRADIAALDLQLKADSDPAKTKERAYVGANQHNYLYGQYAADPVANKWMEPWLLDLEQYMRDKGMFFEK